MIHFDDGISLSRKAAGAFTLSILKNYYAPDLSISENRLVLPEVEMITWSSTKTQVEGQTYFMLDGTSLWLYSGVYKQEQAELYAVLFEEIMESVAFIK